MSSKVNDGTYSHYVHRVVAQHFIENPHDYKFVDHTNGITTDNSVSNLRWVGTLKEDLGRVSKTACNEPIAQLDLKTGNVIKVWERAVFIKRELGLHTGNIVAVCRSKRPRMYGFGWRFANRPE